MKGTRSVIQRPSQPSQRLLLRNSRTCPNCSSGLVQRRAFSHVTPRRAVMGQIQWNQGSESTKARDKMQSQQSMMKNATKTQIPTDMGLMPTTFVSPSVGTLFRMYRNEKKKLLRILLLRLRRGPQTLFTLWYMLKPPIDRLTGKKGKRPPFELKDRLDIARTLHIELYEALAMQDKGKLREIACAGLLAQSQKSIDSLRDKGVKPAKFTATHRGIIPPRWLFRWLPYPLTSYIPTPALKAVSDVVLPLPFGGRGASLRQVVVRIRTRQTITREPSQSGKPKNLEEYVVIQKMIGEGLNSKWMIWGTIQPSDKKQIDKVFMIMDQESGGLWNSLKNLMPSWGGGGGSAMA